MRNIWTIAKREYRLFFISPIAYVFMFVILFTLGLFFYLDIIYAVSTQQYVPNAQRSLQLLVFPLLFFAIPALTMRSLSDENKSGTLELLLTAPLTEWQLIVGKWAGCVLFFATVFATTLVFPFILNTLISPGIDQGLLVTGYIGLLLLTSGLCAMGVFVSSLFSNQLAALFTSLGLIILTWVIGTPAQVSTSKFAAALQYLSVPEHFYNSFLAGIIKLDDVVFFLSLTAVSLFLGYVSVETRRWR